MNGKERFENLSINGRIILKYNRFPTADHRDRAV
jgi:hypothetical protein